MPIAMITKTPTEAPAPTAIKKSPLLKRFSLKKRFEVLHREAEEHFVIKEQHFAVLWKIFITRDRGSICLECTNPLENKEWSVETTCMLNVFKENAVDKTQEFQATFGPADTTHDCVKWFDWGELREEYLKDGNLEVEVCVIIKKMTGFYGPSPQEAKISRILNSLKKNEEKNEQNTFCARYTAALRSGVFRNISKMKIEETRYGGEEDHHGFYWRAYAHRLDCMLGLEVPDRLTFGFGCQEWENPNDWKVDVDYALVITSKNGEKKIEKGVESFKKNDITYVLLTSIEWKDVEKYMVDDTITMECHVTIKKVTGVQGFDSKEEFSHLFVNVNGEKFSMTKEELISAKSSYFNSLLDREFEKGKKPEITLRDVNDDDPDQFLDALRGDINYDNVLGALYVAQNYHAKAVVDKCQEFIETKCNKKTVVCIENNLALMKLESEGTKTPRSPATIVELADTSIIETMFENRIIRRYIAIGYCRVCHNNPNECARFIRCVYNLLQSQSPAVRYKAAGTLVTLTNAPAAVKAAASAYIELIVKESDNNVKFIFWIVLLLFVTPPVMRKYSTIQFPDVASTIIPVLMEFLSDSNETAAQFVIQFVREAVHKLPNLKSAILASLREGITFIQSLSIFMSALWILATYCDAEGSLEVLRIVKTSLGELPIVDSEIAEQEEPKVEEVEQKKDPSGPKVTADGTYATQTALSNTVVTKKNEKPPLRRFLLNFFLGVSLATILTKLSQQFTELDGAGTERSNRFRAECMLILASIIHLAKSGLISHQVNEDDLDRMGAVIKIIAQGIPGLDEKYGDSCKKSLELMLGAKSISRLDAADKLVTSGSARSKDFVEIDKTINFTQLLANNNQQGENLYDSSLSQALGTAPKDTKFDYSKLGKVIQLAGFSDPIYAEAYVNVNQYDTVLDILIVNRTSDILQNVSLELATVGDLKLVDKPTPVTLAPNDFSNIKATVKVASTENGVSFSTISYDVRGSTSDRNCVYLQDIKIDIMDYIVPGNITDTEFRQMWSDFEWENKVNVMTPIRDLREFLNHLSTFTNMKVLTGDAAIEGECGFLAANLCAHSIFGEDSLANVSVEKALPMDGSSPIVGHIRIRAKSQGMCLTLGDKLSSAMRSRD